MFHEDLPEVSFAAIAVFVQELLKFKPVDPNKLGSFLAWSANPHSKTDLLTNGMINRVPSASFPDCHINSQEVPSFKLRIDLMANDNPAYRLAMKNLPTTEDLTEFSLIKPCWSTLFPVKLYLMYHPAQAREYYGLQPYGKHVIKAYNSLTDQNLAGQPTFADHLALQELTNRLAMLSGMTTSWVNSWMYLCGQDMQPATEGHMVRRTPLGGEEVM